MHLLCILLFDGEMAKKTKFENQLSVIRIRKQYAAPYLKSRFVYLKRRDISTQKKFVKALADTVKSWPDGTYYLKLSTGKVFVRFEVKEGKIRTIYKTSPITGEKYPIWEYMKRR